MPRWVLALLAADGFFVPISWTWVHGVSAVFGAAMTILEGIAIAYILGAMVVARGMQLRWLAALVGATCASFIGVLAPSIYSRVTGAAVGAVLPAWGIWVWSSCVAASTILTVAAVGYAQAVITSANDWRRVAAQWQGEAEKLRAEAQGLGAELAQKDAELAAQDIQVRSFAEQNSSLANTLAQEREAKDALAQAYAQVDAKNTQANAYTCAQCGTSFGKQQGLAAHMRHTHHNGHGKTAQSEPEPQAPQFEAGQAQEAAR